jgi:hypothetical protein
MNGPANKSGDEPGKRLRKRENKKNGHLPCAGITLVRFNGYHLSLCSSLRNQFGWNASTPGNLRKLLGEKSPAIWTKPKRPWQM